jgi:hypothetical protein
MKRVFLILLLSLLAVTFTACSTQEKGSREFIPGQGWVPT